LTVVFVCAGKAPTANRQNLDDRKAMLQHIRPDEWRAILSGARAAEEKKAPKK